LDLLIRIWRDFWRDPWQLRFTLPLIVVNGLGSLYGYYWYHEQLAASPVYLWTFVADSPFATTLLTLALLLRGGGVWVLLFQTVAFTAAVKYGIWAIVIITQYWFGGGPVEIMVAALWLSHLGMAVEGAIFLKNLRPGLAIAAFTGLWMLLNDLMDYSIGIHPYLYTAGQKFLAASAALALTIIIAGSLCLRELRRTTRRAQN